LKDPSFGEHFPFFNGELKTSKIRGTAEEGESPYLRALKKASYESYFFLR
jgi:hypothetical protein